MEPKYTFSLKNPGEFVFDKICINTNIAYKLVTTDEEVLKNFF